MKINLVYRRMAKPRGGYRYPLWASLNPIFADSAPLHIPGSLFVTFVDAQFSALGISSRRDLPRSTPITNIGGVTGVRKRGNSSVWTPLAGSVCVMVAPFPSETFHCGTSQDREELIRVLHAAHGQMVTAVVTFLREHRYVPAGSVEHVVSVDPFAASLMGGADEGERVIRI